MKNTKERLQDVQDMLGLTQKGLGVYIGVSIRTVNSWMTGDRECPSHVVELTERCAQADAAGLDDDKTSHMMRWAVIDSAGADEWLTVCGSKADAMREAQSQWEHLTKAEQDSRERFAVALVNVQLSKEHGKTIFTWAFEDDGYTADGTWYEVGKEWK